MKRILITVSLSSLLHAAQQPQQYIPQLPPGVLYPSMVFHIHSNADARNQVEQAVSMKTITTQQMTAPTQAPLEQNIGDLCTALTTYIKHHWFFCSIVALSTLYTSILTYLLYAHYAIHEQHMWSRWRSHETFEQLAKEPQDLLTTALIKDIASHYINPQNPTDALWPLAHFLEAIKQEEARLKSYISVAGILKKTPLTRILPTLQDEAARDALTRLHFVYHLFTTWSADLTWEKLTAQPC